jgi:hypothetical protein
MMTKRRIRLRTGEMLQLRKPPGLTFSLSPNES